MTYSFDIEIAQEIGVDEAIILQNIVFWLTKNKANGLNYFDGRYWTYNSHKAFRELFPFWSESQIKRILQSLFDKNVILKGNYNSNPYDKTNWYALSDEYSYLIGVNNLIDETKSSNREDEVVSSLHTDIKPYGKTTDNKLQIVNKDVEAIIDYLNQKIGSNYKSNTKSTVSHIKARLKEGFTLDDFYTVIDKKVLLWGKDIKMQAYLRPETLFGTKFESYLNEVVSQGKILQAQGVLSGAGAKTMEVAQEWIND